ncbi:NUDIX domain-containing protein [uncultured Polaribacter sp.]|uniref:NUDIX hydrolase n=1 Tax=uncultured Polaribacter sp. TaxID=174711 RepID=UPI00262AE34A|nr:NUDIX domain-containing protein [uncultured Polaribacter sp.]
MYKVFVNDKPIIVTSSQQKDNNFPVYILKNIVFEEIVYKLKNNLLEGVNLYVQDLDAGWQQLLQNIKVVSAAGGLVLNDKKEVLFIFRNGTWDLPKGRIEKGEAIEETAVREVEEECGIQNLKLIASLITTYHVYFEEKIKLKETFWFLMSSNFKGKLIPQLEEGITEVGFKSTAEITKALQNSYKNIELVYDTYLKM